MKFEPEEFVIDMSKGLDGKPRVPHDYSNLKAGDPIYEEDEDAQCEHGNYYNQVECEDCINANEIPDSGEEE